MNYTSWLMRVGTNTVDGLVAVPLLLSTPFLDTPGAPRWIALGVGLLSMVLFGYNRWYLAGRTGQSWGRRLFGVRLVGDRTGRPIGARRAALRDVAHALDVAVFYIGYLMPLFTAKRRTIADMVCRTVVVRDRPAPAVSPA
jgi:uncharacterized RDD family membrane protein YckC